MAKVSFYYVDGKTLSPDNYEALEVRLTETERYRLPDKRKVGARHRHILSRALMRYGVTQEFGGLKSVEYPKDNAPYILDAPVHLSLSHCGSIAAIAIGHDCLIGCDVLTSGRSKHWRQLVNRWFHAAEIDWVMAASES